MVALSGCLVTRAPDREADRRAFRAMARCTSAVRGWTGAASRTMADAVLAVAPDALPPGAFGALLGGPLGGGVGEGVGEPLGVGVGEGVGEPLGVGVGHGPGLWPCPFPLPGPGWQFFGFGFFGGGGLACSQVWNPVDVGGGIWVTGICCNWSSLVMNIRQMVAGQLPP